MQSQKTWVLLLTAIISATAVVLAAIIGVDAKHDRDQRDAEIQKLREQIANLEASNSPQPNRASEDEAIDRDEVDRHLIRAPAQTVETRERAPSSSNQSQVDPSKPLKSESDEPPVVVRGNFRFALRGCFHTDHEQLVRCNLLVENISDANQALIFNPPSYMGGRTSFLATEDGKQYSARIEPTVTERGFVPGVPTAVDLIFDGIIERLGKTTLVLEADNGLFGPKYTLRFPLVVTDEEVTNTPNPTARTDG